MLIYPLNAVISNNHNLIQHYNYDFASSLFLSECITPSTALDLVRIGAKFDKIILVNSEGHELIELIGTLHDWNEETMPFIENITISDDVVAATVEAHRIIQRFQANCGAG